MNQVLLNFPWNCWLMLFMSLFLALIYIYRLYIYIYLYIAPPSIAHPESSNSNPASVHQTNSGNSPANTNQSPECGLKLKNQKGLKIHQSSKHQRKQNVPTCPGFWSCLSDAKCDIYRQGLFSTSVTSTNNGKIHNVKQPVTCKTKNVCYLINCKICNQQYTGETNLEVH